MSKNLFVIGTRPEFIKISPIANSLNAKILFTNQHFSQNMSKAFYSLVKNCEIIKIKKSNNLIQHDIKEYIKKINPDNVTVQGDTNTTLLGAVAAKSLNNVKLFYLESGIRNYDLREIEETNRILISYLANINFVNHENNKNNLIQEKVPGKIFVTGSTVYASLLEQGLINDNIKSEDFILVTLHRPINVDYVPRLKSILNAIDSIGVKVIFPIHPRTEKILNVNKFKNIELIKPLSYKKFINILKKSKLVISDSGGLQEECVIFRKPLIIPMKHPVRPELVNKFNIMAHEPKKILIEANRFYKGNSIFSEISSIDNNIYGKEDSIEKILKYY